MKPQRKKRSRIARLLAKANSIYPVLSKHGLPYVIIIVESNRDATDICDELVRLRKNAK